MTGEPKPVRLRLFARAREAAGTSEMPAAPGGTLDALLAAACERFGPEFAAVLERSRVWVNGDEPARGPATVLGAGDEVAVLPPVSGGCAPSRADAASPRRSAVRVRGRCAWVR